MTFLPILSRPTSHQQLDFPLQSVKKKCYRVGTVQTLPYSTQTFVCVLLSVSLLTGGWYCFGGIPLGCYASMDQNRAIQRLWLDTPVCFACTSTLKRIFVPATAMPTMIDISHVSSCSYSRDYGTLPAVVLVNTVTRDKTLCTQQLSLPAKVLGHAGVCQLSSSLFVVCVRAGQKTRKEKPKLYFSREETFSFCGPLCRFLWVFDGWVWTLIFGDIEQQTTSPLWKPSAINNVFFSAKQIAHVADRLTQREDWSGLFCEMYQHSLVWVVPSFSRRRGSPPSRFPSWWHRFKEIYIYIYIMRINLPSDILWKSNADRSAFVCFFSGDSATKIGSVTAVVHDVCWKLARPTSEYRCIMQKIPLQSSLWGQDWFVVSAWDKKGHCLLLTVSKAACWLLFNFPKYQFWNVKIKRP